MSQIGERRRGADQAHRDAVTRRPDHSTDVERVATRAAEIVLARITCALVGAPETYSTRAGCAPPGYSRDAWRRVARQIGTRRGRWYVVTREQLDAHERGQIAHATANDATEWSPASALAGAGLRRA
jgi:hypothetical protein